MQIVKLKAYTNGAHENQTLLSGQSVPSGWALIPGVVDLPNFPFGEAVTEERDGVLVVTEWRAGTIPPDPEPEPSPTLEERVGSLEKSKANQADVDELNEALNMILTGATK